ncbi:MAG: carboxypeptidase-like regulatory domain-containing protein [archaeon]
MEKLELRKTGYAFFVVVLLTLGMIAVPAQAHFTLGIYKGTRDYHDTDFDGAQGAHIPGLTGYVFPGAGPATTPFPGMLNQIPGVGLTGYPGYQSLYPGGNPPGSDQKWLQADASAYAPFGAILTSTVDPQRPFSLNKLNQLLHNGNPTIWGPRDNEIGALPIEHEVRGELIFAVNYTLPKVNGIPQWPSTPYRFDRMEIYIPPEFQDIDTVYVVASFTNSWGNIDNINHTDVDAITFPNRWTRIRVNSDSAMTGLTTGRYIEFGNKTLGDVWAYIRVNNVVAPTIAGKYFFKIALRNQANGEYIWLGTPGSPYHTFLTNGVPNWPVLLVKGEVDPAYVDGVIRYGGYSGVLYYGEPIKLAGRVRLVGQAINPFTLEPTGRPVEARGYFNSTANGHFEVEGVAPGIYNIYASAAGYPEKLIQQDVQIMKGQSYHVDCYLAPGVVIQGEVFSKCGSGEVPWMTWQENPNDGVTTQDIKIEIYSTKHLRGKQVDCLATTEALTWSPVSTKQKAGATLLGGWGDITIGFPWPGYGGKYANGFDPDGVGPPQKWQVSSSQTSFQFKFGDKGLYGAPTMLDGHVPQLNATWIDGLPPGRYEVQAFTYGYVQTKLDGTTFETVSFSVPADEWPGDISVPFDLHLSSYVAKTVHFHDVAGTMQEKPIPGNAAAGENRTLHLEVLDKQDSVWGWKTKTVLAGSLSTTIYSRGIRGQTMSYWGSGWGRNYGIFSGTYTVKAYMWGYVEQAFETVNMGLCGSPCEISDHMYRGATFNVTFYSSDWQHPTNRKAWKYPEEYIYLQIWKDGVQLTGYLQGRAYCKMGEQYWDPDGNTFTHDGRSVPFGAFGKVRSSFRVKQGNYTLSKGISWAQKQSSFANLYYEGQEANKHTDADVGYYPTSFESGVYQFVGLTYGYVMQAKPFYAYSSKGSVADIPITLVPGLQIQLTIRFKHESIFEHLRFNSSVRVRVFYDQCAPLVGEWLTSNSINGTSSAFNNAGQVIKGDPPGILPRSLNSVGAVYGPGFSLQGTSSNGGAVLESVNYVPRSTSMLNITICGLPDPYTTGSGRNTGALYQMRAYDRIFDVSPWTPGEFGAPGAPYGIPARPLYNGGYFVEAEVVPFGRDIDNRHATSASGISIYDGWYPPVTGLLYGESSAIDPRTGTSYDWSPCKNHIGPYRQRVHVSIPTGFMGGGASAIFELDLLGSMKGIVYDYTWCDDWRTTSWVKVIFSGLAGTFTYYTYDGYYDAYLPAGRWKMDVIAWNPDGEGYKTKSYTIAVSDGQVGGYNVYLEESRIPIPEFSTALAVVASTITAAICILRRRDHRKKPIL